MNKFLVENLWCNYCVTCGKKTLNYEKFLAFNFHRDSEKD